MRLPFYGSYAVTQPFGVNKAAYSQFGMIGHNGIDYNLPTGTPVVAAHDGTAYNLSDPPGFGNYVEVVGNGVKTVYAHLQSYNVPHGARVTEGQQIGRSNNTGNSSGPHLHFGVKPIPADNNNGFFGAVDPAPYLKGAEVYEGRSAEDWAIQAKDAEQYKQGVVKSKSWKGGMQQSPSNITYVIDSLEDFKAQALANPTPGSTLDVSINGTKYVPKGN